MGLYIPPENKRRDEINIKKSTIRLFKEVLDRIQEDHLRRKITPIYLYSLI